MKRDVQFGGWPLELQMRMLFGAQARLLFTISESTYYFANHWLVCMAYSCVIVFPETLSLISGIVNVSLNDTQQILL